MARKGDQGYHHRRGDPSHDRLGRFACRDGSRTALLSLRTAPTGMRSEAGALTASLVFDLANLRLFVEDPSLQGRSAKEVCAFIMRFWPERESDGADVTRLEAHVASSRAWGADRVSTSL